MILKSDSEISAMRPSGILAAQCLDMVEKLIRPGVSTLELNDACHAFIIDAGAIPAPLNYKGFPKSVCTSINHVVCHGIPSAKDVLREGDIINVDVTTILHGYHGDTSRTFCVGSHVSPGARKLTDCARESLDRGINAVKPGARVGDIGSAIQQYAEKLGFSVVREFVGHGIGRIFHEEPQIPHYGRAGKGVRLEPGMVFTIEPMINEGKWQTKVLPDGWTAVTIDRKLSAQFEHTIAIRSDWTVEVLTVAESPR